MSRRVVVTGVGLITPLAADVDNTWSRLIKSESGIKAINTDRFDSSDLACKIAGQVPFQSDNIEHHFNPLDYISEKDSKRTDRFIHYGIAAAIQADEENDLYNQAVAIIQRDQKVSTSYIQRQLRIGYNRAANIVERMEKEDIVSAPNYSGKREILVE